MSSSRRIPFTSTSASVLLDLVRAVAALIVCLEHWRNLLFVDYRQIAAHRALFAVPYVMTDAGHQAVVIFFVLSGYLISGSVFRMTQRGEWSWKLYLTHRIVRLWIVLVPALVLGALLDNAGLRLHLAPALYAGQTGTHMLGDIAQSLHPPIFFGNLIFLQTILVPTFGTNGPMWSLANEFWYYVLFPCAFLALRRRTTAGARILNALIFVLCAWFIGQNILLLFPLWLLGTLLAVVPAPRNHTSVRVLAGALFPAAVFSCENPSRAGSMVRLHSRSSHFCIPLAAAWSKERCSGECQSTSRSHRSAILLHSLSGAYAISRFADRVDSR
jgi:peptidoglycan/LPS O-acetylase OafA/YrhL